ncbi:hydrogenase maturation protease [Arthrobacter sp. ISL-48]|uniref:hydrogenase maturation protease n=1 Tax=Arthrobacter sp. ISL-48 TaxID=2819110 RepID=UPI001BE76C76|nr:hydrogenase maturation protease [Arthrobacter sp. ISL-48]MBT2533870.1 hydrogenase maturation protease [Arthrobacter sp. ISL-48]
MTVLVAGVGNMFLRDDGFGPEVARRLASGGTLPPGVEVVDYGIRGMHLAYDLLAGVDMLVLVDAVPPASGPEPDGSRPSSPGSLRVLRIRSEDLDGGASLDPHGMDPASVLGKLRTLGGEVPVTYVVGCVPADVTEGVGLTPPVAAALPWAVAAVVDLLSHYTSKT